MHFFGVTVILSCSLVFVSFMRNNSMQRWKLCELEDKRRKKNQRDKIGSICLYSTALC